MIYHNPTAHGEASGAGLHLPGGGRDGNGKEDCEQAKGRLQGSHEYSQERCYAYWNNSELSPPPHPP